MHMNRFGAQLALMAALAAFACTKDVKLLESTSQRIGAAGGALESADGVFVLIIPPGALDREVLFTIATVRDGLHYFNAESAIYVVDPSSSTFLIPAEIQMKLPVARSGSSVLVSMAGSDAVEPLPNGGPLTDGTGIHAAINALSAGGYLAALFGT